MRVEDGCAEIVFQLPGWTAAWAGGDLLYRAKAPDYATSGIVVEGRTPDQVVYRARRIFGVVQRSEPQVSGVLSETTYEDLASLPVEPDDTEAQISRTTTSCVDESYVMARTQGYTGDSCPHCGSLKVRKDGYCSTCEDCGATSGCG